MVRSIVISCVVVVSAAVAVAALPVSSARADATGSLSGTVGPSTRAAGPAVVWVEGVAADSWTLPRRRLVVSQRGARFRPDFLVVVVGESVVMPNDDRITHNVFSVSPARRFDLGHYPSGQSRNVTFDRPGIVDLFCNIHENMHATIVVAPSPFYALVDGEGRYQLRGVPNGTFRVVAYAPRAGKDQARLTFSGAPVVKDFTLHR